jgi:hypothetical protein
MKGILATGNTETKREIVPSGTHIARCYSMIHIGTVEWEWQGETKYSNKIRVTFELPHEMRDLEGWRGKSFTNKELAHFDITNLISKECNISIIHKTSKSGNEFAQIGSIAGMSKGTECPKQFNDSFIFNYQDNFNEEWLELQPDWIQDQIKNTDEYKNKMNQNKFKDTPTDDMTF